MNYSVKKIIKAKVSYVKVSNISTNKVPFESFIITILSMKGLQFYLNYGEDLKEVIFGLDPIEQPLMWQLIIC